MEEPLPGPSGEKSVRQQMQAEERLLDRCPFCGYLLRGLPELHDCPECGQPFDRRWEVFGTESFWSRLSWYWRLLIGLGQVALAFEAMQAAARKEVAAFWPVLFLALILHGVLRRSQVFLAVGPAGIVVLHRKNGRLSTYDWSHVGAADLDCRDRPVLRVDGQDVTLMGWKAGHAAADRCVRCINAYLDGEGEPA